MRFTALVFSCRTGAGRSAQLKRVAELVDRRVTVFHPEQTFEPPAARRRCAIMDKERVEEALFQIEGPDEDGCVWACSTEGRDVWCANLGPRDKVATVMSQWLALQDCDEGACEEE